MVGEPTKIRRGTFGVPIIYVGRRVNPRWDSFNDNNDNA